MQNTGRVACDTIHRAQCLHHVQSSFNDLDIACKLVRFLRLSAHPGSLINCHSRIERVFTLHVVTDDRGISRKCTRGVHRFPTIPLLPGLSLNLGSLPGIKQRRLFSSTVRLLFITLNSKYC